MEADSNSKQQNAEQPAWRPMWVLGNPDEFPGKCIYPSWQGALDEKRIVGRDIRWMGGESYVLHNPWRNVVEAEFSSIKEVEAYIREHGTVQEIGWNSWD